MNLSEFDHVIKPFKLRSLEDMDEDIVENEESFISFFSEETHDFSNEKTSQEPQVEVSEQNEPAIDIEAEARKIFEDAYKEGEKAGFDMGMKKAEPILKRLNSYINALQRFREDMMERTERLSLELALIFAEAIILKDCEEYRDTVIRMAKKAMEICEDKYNIKIRIRKDDIKYISEEVVKSINIIPDDTLFEPGFVIETDFGDIDGSISIQLNELRKLILSKKYGD